MSTAQDIQLQRLPSPPDLRFDGRVVWITGASRGIGRELALALAGAGAQLVISARNAASLNQVADTIRKHNESVLAISGSVTDPESIATTVEAIAAAHGRLDVLINNAGISPYFSPAEQLAPSRVREVLDTNTVGPFSCCLAALPLLKASDHPSVVNVSSIHGTRGQERLIAYAASKGGLEMVTRTLAIEWAQHGIRVNSLAPGYVETEMTEGLRTSTRWNEKLLARIPLGRFATIEEIVSCAMFLASPASSYVTGATLVVDGGWSAR